MKYLISIIFVLLTNIGFTQIDTYKNNNLLNTSSNVYYLSAYGAVSDADIGINSTTFGTDNTLIIQRVLDKALSTPIVVYWDGKYSVKGLKIYSNTSIIAFEGCGAILRDKSNKPLLRNSNRSFTSYADCNISIQGGMWNGNGFNDIVNPAQIHDDPEEGYAGWVSVFQFFGVENLRIKDAVIYKPRTFALHAGKVKNVFIQNVKIDVGKTAPINCDGLHFDGPSENITIRDCSIYAKDDHIAFNADEEPGGDITDVTIDNIKLEGGLFGIRLLTRKYMIDRMTISNIHGSTKEYWLIADTYWQKYPNEKGNLGTIYIENINVESLGRNVSFPLNYSYANIHANAECLIFKNINRNKFEENYFPSILVSGTNHVIKKLIIEGYNSSENTILPPKTTNHIEINGAKVNYLAINNSTVTREYPTNNSPLLCVKDGGSVDVLHMDNIYCKGINNVVDVEGEVGHISASNIIHTEASKGQGTFKAEEGIIIPKVVLTNYTGGNPTSGKGNFLRTKGDGFAKSQFVNNFDNTTFGNKRTVLILGNSIVLHHPKPEIGWYGDWGMAASVKDSDFVHLLIRDIHRIAPSVKIKFKNIADFERNFDTYSLSELDSLRNPDILILKISENVKDTKAVEDNFIRYYDRLVKYIAPQKQSVKVIVNGFWDKKNVNTMIEEYAFKKKYPFVSITDLSKDSANMAIDKFQHKGVASHPSDKGMRMIEQRIWNVVKNCFKK